MVLISHLRLNHPETSHVYSNPNQLILFDADGTIVDAFAAIETTFVSQGMELGDLERFQKRHNFFKYLGGLKELPTNLKKQLSKQGRKKLLSTLTDVYRESAELYPGMADLLRTLLAAPGIRVGLVTRNITHEPALTMRMLFARHDIDLSALDFMAHIPLGQEKKEAFRDARKKFDINPARSFACGDEHKDYRSAIGAGMHALIVSYGFEDFTRLTKKFDVPEEVISRTPDEFCARILHTFNGSVSCRGSK